MYQVMLWRIRSLCHSSTRAHSVRAIVPKRDSYKGALKETIIEAADWRNQTSLFRHYLRHLHQDRSKIWKNSAGGWRYDGYKHNYHLTVSILLCLHRLFRVKYHMWNKVKLKISLINLGFTSEHVILTYPTFCPHVCLACFLFTFCLWLRVRKKHMVLGACAGVWGSRGSVFFYLAELRK